MSDNVQPSSEENLQRWLYTRLFEHVPCTISIIDRTYTIVENNRNFVELFGEGRGKRCFQTYKRRASMCQGCAAEKTFLDGKVRVNEEVGVDRLGRTAHYIVHMAPIFDDQGNIPYIVEMATDITETKRLQREYQVLFERVPCYIGVLNKDMRIIRANAHLQETFGDPIGKYCYEVYKKRTDACPDCPAMQTFRDGQVHVSHQVGQTLEGDTTHYVVTTSPLTRDESPISNVIEIANDMTELFLLENALNKANLFREKILHMSFIGIIALDEHDSIFIANPAIEEMFGIPAAELIGGTLPEGSFDPDFSVKLVQSIIDTPVDVDLASRDGEVIPVRISSVELKNDEMSIGRAIFIRDLRRIRQLEKEKVDAERLAAVGQTVANLAHGIKNILMGIEGGMYIMNSGIQKSNTSRIHQGWDILERNIGKISTMSKNLLNFSKGRPIKAQLIKPADLLRDIFNLYQESAQKEHVTIEMECDDTIDAAPFDPDELHTCLANLVSNAIDACKMSDKPHCTITVRCYLQHDDIVFDVEDQGCGMDYEVKQKIFTNFFTTKGTEGTGLGLLTTRKIVQEHGGRIEFESFPGQGSRFRLIFSRHRLPPLENQ